MRCPPGSSATPTDARTASATRRVSFFDSDSSRNLGLGRERARIATPARPAPNCLQNPNRIVFNCVATIALVFCVFGAYPFTRQFSALDIMSQAHGLGSCVRCPLVIRLGAGSLGHLTPLWFAPTLLWLSSSSHMLLGLCWMGMFASLLLVLNIWPRAMLVICFACFLSFVSAAQDFSGYQSDGMLLEAGFISLFFAPPGIRPGWGAVRPPIRASLFLLQWEWFRIYFESGIAKIASGDPQWRNLTAMDEYYQNGPLPTWIGWYVQHLPHWFHASSAYATLALELGLVWMLFLPRRWRIVCFFIVTPWEVGVILTANYTFLNYLVLALGFLLLDDRFLVPFVLRRWKAGLNEHDANPLEKTRTWEETSGLQLRAVKLPLVSVMLCWIFYSMTVRLMWLLSPHLPLPTAPVSALEPFRIANQY